MMMNGHIFVQPIQKFQIQILREGCTLHKSLKATLVKNCQMRSSKVLKLIFVKGFFFPPKLKFGDEYENLVMKVMMCAGDDLLCYTCNLLNRGNPTPCPGVLVAFPGAQVSGSNAILNKSDNLSLNSKI